MQLLYIRIGRFEPGYISVTSIVMISLRPYSHETFWHTILRYCDKKICNKKIIFRHRFLLNNQGKLWKNIPWFFPELTLAYRDPWPKNIVLSQYCVQKCLVWIRPYMSKILRLPIRTESVNLTHCDWNCKGKFIQRNVFPFYHFQNNVQRRSCPPILWRKTKLKKIEWILPQIHNKPTVNFTNVKRAHFSYECWFWQLF